MLRDDDLFPPHMEGLTDRNDSEELESGMQHRNDDLDDVFGSAPGSPVFGGEDHHDQHRERGEGGGNLEYSDIPRLKEKHETEGYRDGVTKGKAESVQKGFDEGYSLGAMVGLRVGKILGLLEEIGKAAAGREEKERVDGLYKEALVELETRSVFGRDYWGEDGIWKFEVPEDNGKDVTFEDVTQAHPLIKKWGVVVEKEVERWGLNLGIMDGEHEVVDDDTETVPTGAGKGAVATKKAAEEPAAPPGKIMGIPKSDLNW